MTLPELPTLQPITGAVAKLSSATLAEAEAMKKGLSAEICIDLYNRIASGELGPMAGPLAILDFVHRREAAAASNMANAILEKKVTP